MADVVAEATWVKRVQLVRMDTPASKASEVSREEKVIVAFLAKSGTLECQDQSGRLDLRDQLAIPVQLVFLDIQDPKDQKVMLETQVQWVHQELTGRWAMTVQKEPEAFVVTQAAREVLVRSVPVEKLVPKDEQALLVQLAQLENLARWDHREARDLVANVVVRVFPVQLERPDPQVQLDPGATSVQQVSMANAEYRDHQANKVPRAPQAMSVPRVPSVFQDRLDRGVSGVPLDPRESRGLPASAESQVFLASEENRAFQERLESLDRRESVVIRVQLVKLVLPATWV